MRITEKRFIEGVLIKIRENDIQNEQRRQNQNMQTENIKHKQES